MSTPTERLVVLDDDVRQSIAATEQRCDVLRHAHARAIARERLRQLASAAVVEPSQQAADQRTHESAEEGVVPDTPGIEADPNSADNATCNDGLHG